MKKLDPARKGGLARIQLHGNPGTAAGRRLGGLRSVAKQKKGKTGFTLLRQITPPRGSPELAELCGILAGDGHIGEYQISVTTNSETDLEHAKYVQRLFTKLFKIPVSFSVRKKQNACVVYVSSKEISNFLVRKGMVRGNKIAGALSTPTWVRARKSYTIAFIRGLFDTDGCVYTDSHKIRGRVYKNLGMAFTNRCTPLLSDFKNSLEDLGLHPTQKTSFTVFLRREKDIRQYFAQIGSANPKHTEKVAYYFSNKQGGVA